MNTDAVVLSKGAHFSFKQANDNTRRSGALCGKKSSHFLLFIAPKKPLVILQKKDHEINAHHPSYMDGAHARLKRIASEWCDSPCSPDKKQTDAHTHARATAQRRRPNASGIQSKAPPNTAIYKKPLWSGLKFQNVHAFKQGLNFAEIKDLYFPETSTADKSRKTFIPTMHLRVEAGLTRQFQISIHQFGTKQSRPQKISASAHTRMYVDDQRETVLNIDTDGHQNTQCGLNKMPARNDPTKPVYERCKPKFRHN